MVCFDYSADNPAMNLALDEALLEEAEAGRSGETLRFWESPSHFVVVGLTQSLDEVVHRDRCESDGIPILRRCSAGGCVLQGPGCLNFSLVLDTRQDPALTTIRGSYQWILGRLAAALSEIGVHAKPEGISDLATDGLKFSGNAQRRKKRYILHHGTLLYDFPLDKIPLYLKEPEAQPNYRSRRSHGDFLRNLPVLGSEMRSSISGQFSAIETLIETPNNCETLAQELYTDKYATALWNFRK